MGTPFCFSSTGMVLHSINTTLQDWLQLSPMLGTQISSFFCAISKAIITPSSLGISFSSNSTKLNLLLKIGERDEIVLVLKHNPMSYAFIFLVEFHCSPFDLLEEAIDDKVLLFWSDCVLFGPAPKRFWLVFHPVVTLLVLVIDHTSPPCWPNNTLMAVKHLKKIQAL